MNLAEFNYMHREKVENQLVLPHPPTYVTQEKNKARDVWYFTSQKFITLKKKPQNTTFSNFLKTTIPIQPNQQDKQNQTQSNNPTTRKQPPKQSSSQKNQSLLFIFKQRANYLQSKLTHIINDHEQPNDRTVWSQERSRCRICGQLQDNDYDFVVMDKELFSAKLQQQRKKNAQGVTQCQTSSLGSKIDRILKSMLFQNTTIHKEQSQRPKIQSSTFNQYLCDLGSQFKYYITRIQTHREKHHYMVENKNRVNYRSKVHFNFYVKQQPSNDHHHQGKETIQNTRLYNENNKKLAQQISSVVWNRQYVLFDVEKIYRIDSQLQPAIINSDKIAKVTNSHMKQKITQKCQLIQKFLEKRFNKLFEQTFKNKSSSANDKNNEQNSINKIKYCTHVKQFRLWFMNNNMKNNHAYTICVSDLKVQFTAQNFGVTFKRWQGNFWTRVDLKKGLGLLNQIQQKRLNIRLRNNTIQSLDPCSVRLKAKSNYSHMKRRNDIKRQLMTNQTLESKEMIDLKEQSLANDSQQNCTCCLSLIDYTNNLQAVSKRLIISRHMPKLRQMVQTQVQATINQINKQLFVTSHNQLKYTKARPPEQLKKQNQLVGELQRNQAKITNLKSLTHEQPNITQQTISLSRKKDLHDIYKRQYEEVRICEQCYTTFLQKVIKSKIPLKTSIRRMGSIANSKMDSKKVNSFFYKETAQSEKQQLPQTRQRIYSVKNHIGTSFEKYQRHQHLYSNQFNSKHKAIINSYTLLNSRARLLTHDPSQQLSQAFYKQKKERLSTKDNTTIYQLPTEKVIIQRESANIGDNIQKNKKKTRLEKYQEDLQNQNF